VYLFAAFAVVFYTWLDCFDGKQARRTGTSSPLGQLFDHGCDALSVNLLLANIGASLGVPCGWAHGTGMFGVSGSSCCSSCWCSSSGSSSSAMRQ
jgi:ethanolaminephosphotransferase